MADERLLLDPRSAAKRLSIGRTTIYELMKSGEIESISIGRSRRIPADAIASWIESKRAPTLPKVDAPEVRDATTRPPTRAA